MDERLKQRLVGAAVLVLAAVIFVPMLLDRGDDEPPRLERAVAPAPADTSARVVPLEADATSAAPSAPTGAPAQPVAEEQTPAELEPAPVVSSSPAATRADTTQFAVQLGSFSKADNAEGLRDRLIAKGYAAYVESAGSITRVYVGPQPDRAEAEKVLKKLRAETKLKGIVVERSG